MHTFLGLVGLAVFIPCVIAFAAAITWVVVKVSPTQPPDKPESSSA